MYTHQHGSQNHHPNKSNNDLMKTLWIGDIQPWFTKNYIQGLFHKSDNIVNVKIIKKNGKSQKGQFFGFLVFKDHKSAKSALQKYNGKKIPFTQSFFNLNWSFEGGLDKRRKEHKKKQRKSPQQILYKIYVGDIEQNVKETQLFNLFQQRYPSTVQAKIIVDPVTKKNKGYAFISFTSKEESLKSLQEMNGFHLNGKFLKLNCSFEKRTMVKHGQNGNSQNKNQKKRRNQKSKNNDNKRQIQNQDIFQDQLQYYQRYQMNAQLYYQNSAVRNAFLPSSPTMNNFMSEQQHYYSILQQQQQLALSKQNDQSVHQKKRQNANKKHFFNKNTKRSSWGNTDHTSPTPEILIRVIPKNESASKTPASNPSPVKDKSQYLDCIVELSDEDQNEKEQPVTFVKKLTQSSFKKKGSTSQVTNIDISEKHNKSTKFSDIIRKDHIQLHNQYMQ